MLFNPVALRRGAGPRPCGAGRACCRARSSRSRASPTAGSAGRGSSPRGPRRWARSRSTRGSPSSAARASSTSSSSRRRSPSTSSTTARDDIREVTERILEREHPDLWHDLPPQRQGARPRAGPGAAARDRPRRSPTTSATNIEHLMDIKLMVIRRIEERPELANRIFQDVGQQGAALHHQLRLLLRRRCSASRSSSSPRRSRTGGCCRSAASIIGYVTNWVALWMIFEPVEPRRIGPLKLQGLFLRRQPEVADVYAGIIADDIVTLNNIGDELLHGPQSDRTRLDDREPAATRRRPRVGRCARRSGSRSAPASSTRSASRSPPRPSSTR